jgi:hypothetical protein
MSLTSYRAAPPREDYEAKKHLYGVLLVIDDVRAFAICRPGNDLLFRALRQSTIGARSFHFRVRDGIGCGPPAIATRPANSKLNIITFLLASIL